MRKKILAALLSVCMIASLMVVPAAAASTFDDVSSDYWAASAIERWADCGVLTGHGDGTFTPSAPLTRAQFAAMLVKLLGLEAKSDASTFTDLADDWKADAILKCNAAGIMLGNGDGTVGPNVNLTFTQAAAMLCRALGLTDASGSDWAEKAVTKLSDMGLIGKDSSDEVNPSMAFNRGAVAALADRVIEKYVDEDATITGEVKGVVLVVKGAKADIKDATLAAPLVIESAEATLTNTKAQDVKVEGSKAAITTDAASTVEAVTLAGDAPKADIKGSVASVVVEEGATSAAVDVPASMADKVANNSSSAITVNGETQEPTKTDDSTTTSTVTEGSSDPAHVHEWVYVQTGENKHVKKCATCNIPGGEAEDCFASATYTLLVEGDTAKHQATCTVCGRVGTAAAHDTNDDGACSVCGYKVTVNNGNNVCSGSHTFDVVVSNTATCTASGTKITKCSGESEDGTACTATQTETVPASGHSFNEGRVIKEATCTSTGTKVRTCTVCNATKDETVDLLAHNYGDGTEADPYKYTSDATKHYKVCKVCGQKDAGTAHDSWTAGKCGTCNYTCTHVNKTYSKNDDGTSHAVACAACGTALGNETCVYVVTTAAVAPTCTVAGSTAAQKCKNCDRAIAASEVAALDHDYDTTKWAVDTTTGKHYHACKRCDDKTKDAADHTVDTWTNGTGTCSVCNQTVTCVHTWSWSNGTGTCGTCNMTQTCNHPSDGITWSAGVGTCGTCSKNDLSHDNHTYEWVLSGTDGAGTCTTCKGTTTCSHTELIKDQTAGTEVTCPKCNLKVTVPQATP